MVLVTASDIPTDDPAGRGADELLIRPISEETLHETTERLPLQHAYQQAMDKFFRLSTERVVLESELESDLDVTDRYQSVASDLYEPRNRAAKVQDELSGDEFDQTFRQLLG